MINGSFQWLTINKSEQYRYQIDTVLALKFPELWVPQLKRNIIATSKDETNG